MEDSQIVELFFKRNETAVSETEKKYGAYCGAIAERILSSREDAGECVNDALLAAWNAIPPHRPENLRTFLGKIARRLALKKRRDQNREKRGGGAVDLSLEELDECVPSDGHIDDALEAQELTRIIDMFLETLPADERRVFLRRYWYFDSVAAIAERYGFGESRVKMMLKRTRDKLAARLAKEGIIV
ncbi:MAG: sigma-70 family RNA polymerase sigma factor [Clostridia bacterium]|nr:sigma-70 family RNA polymerase sigma factor [Clostridia bacterium]